MQRQRDVDARVVGADLSLVDWLLVVVGWFVCWLLVGWFVCWLLVVGWLLFVCLLVGWLLFVGCFSRKRKRASGEWDIYLFGVKQGGSSTLTLTLTPRLTFSPTSTFTLTPTLTLHLHLHLHQDLPIDP